MVWWVLTVIVLAILWAAMWRNEAKMAFGVLIGLPLGWLFSIYIRNNVTLEEIPVWLPPLPFAIVATLLIVVGLVMWFRGDDDAGSKTERRDDAGH